MELDPAAEARKHVELEKIVKDCHLTATKYIGSFEMRSS